MRDYQCEHADQSERILEIETLVVADVALVDKDWQLEMDPTRKIDNLVRCLCLCTRGTLQMPGHFIQCSYFNWRNHVGSASNRYVEITTE